MNLISRVTLAALASILTACGGGGGDNNGASAGIGLPSCLSAEEIALVGQINATRTGGGKAALPVDTRLVQTSRKNAEQYIATGGNLATSFLFDRGYGETGFTGTSGSDFTSASEFWTAFLADANANPTLPSGKIKTDLTSDTPTAPIHLGIGEVVQTNGKHTFSFILGDTAGAAVNGTCTP